LKSSLKNLRDSFNAIIFQQEDIQTDLSVDRVVPEHLVSTCERKDIKLKRKIWSPTRSKNLTWKNNTPLPDSVLIESMHYWQKACGVKFIKVDTDPFFTFDMASDELENHPDCKEVIAKAFFPGDYPRSVKIFKRFDSQFNKTSVLAHELGHLLGFKHEHIWDPVKHITEEGIGLAEEITDYDPNSIMHYQKIWDDQKNNQITLLSSMDKIGSSKIYGPPLNESS